MVNLKQGNEKELKQDRLGQKREGDSDQGGEGSANDFTNGLQCLIDNIGNFPQISY